MLFADMAYFVEEGFRSTRQNRLMSVVTIVTIAFALMIFGAFLIVYSNVRLITNNWAKEVEITAYLKSDFESDRIDQIKKALWENREIARIEFVSKEDALERFKKEQADSLYLVEGLNGNPLPASFEISLSKAAQNREAVDRLVDKISRISDFSEIQYGQDWTRSLLTFLKILRLIGFIMGGLLGVAIIFIIANTVRLTVYARRDELSVMRLIGATNWFIKGPFLMEGFFQGLIGAVLSLGLLFGLFHFWVPQVRQSAGMFFLQDISISFLSLPMLLSIIGA
ncbi:MAG: permease-like cell division protein FtsX, partial [bacterium]|nr:permease-like cell division protein FtsX [bacterium]